MRGLSQRIFVLTICLLCRPCAAGSEALSPALARALERHPVRGARVGVLVVRLSDGRTLFSRHAEEKFEIASNAKLFTTAAALRRLGTDFQFRTPVVADGEVAEGRLKGNLMIVGGGDPMISGRFYKADAMYVPRVIATTVKEAGITEISGDLVMNDRFFDRELVAPGWAKADCLRWYGAPASALSFNDNCVDVTVTAARTPGRAPRIVISPDVGFARVVNRAVTVARRKAEGLHFSQGGNGVYVVSGRIRVGNRRGESLPVDDPPMYLAAAIKKELAQVGVTLMGEARMIRPGEVFKPEAQTLCAWESPLAYAVKVANQRSQNFFAEQILKTLGASKRGVGSRAAGITEVRAFLKEAGIADGSVSLTDACGLSPGNAATPRAIVKLLTFMHGSKEGEVFLDSLAVNGAGSGTMRNRLKEKAAAGRIHAKTGTVKSRGVSALSGYAMTKDNEMLAFSILINGASREGYYAAKLLENAACRAMLGVPEPKRKNRSTGKRR